jgi:type IX secretion system PorP/SprF family membrane protein
MRTKKVSERPYLNPIEIRKSLKNTFISLQVIFSLTFFILISVNLKSQQLPMYSQYVMNNYLINPAIAGHEGYTSLTLTGREQWVGIKDAPSTYAFSAQTRLLGNSFIMRSHNVRRRWTPASRSKRVGVAAYIYTDHNGAFNRTGFQATYAYHIPLDRSQLSFGVSLTGFQFKINEDKIKLYDEDDELLMGTKKSALIPDANVGVYFTNAKLFVGVSAMQLFQSVLKLQNYDMGPGFKMVRHYFLTAGYKYEINRELFVEPSIMLKMTEKFVSQLDINARLYINKQYWAGLSYRTGGNYSLAEESIGGVGSSIIVMGGIKVENYYFGYSFDYTLSAIGKRTWGTHEFVVAAKFGETARRYRWLNRY